MQAGKKDIQGIFNRSWHLVIPFFQRSYVWTEEEWDRFLNDMYDICEYKQEYFLGSVILKTYSEENQDGIVVDGQQRLTTLVLFFKALLLKQGKNQEFDVIFKKIDDGKPILIHNKNDKKPFELISNLGSLQKIDSPYNNIEKCYNYFVDNIDESRIIFSDLLKHIAFVGINLDFYENEQQIFDTINSLGIKLTTAELLKSLFFKSDEIEFYNHYWFNLFEKDEETINYWHGNVNKDGKALIDMLLFVFLQIKSKDLPTSTKKNFGQINHLLKSYKKLLPTIENKETFIKELSDCARIFRANINPDIKNKQVISQIDRINLIIFEGGLFSIIPYFIFVLIRLGHDENALNDTLFVLESYLMRRMVGIDKGSLIAKDYGELFGVRLIANDIVLANALKIHLNGYKSNNINHVPTDDYIKLLLKNKPQTNAKALLILYLLDNKIRQNKEKEVLFEFSKYGIEYLMPKNWQKNWDTPIDKDMRDLAVRTLGNMTFSPIKLNAALKNASWYHRVNGQGKMRGLISCNHFSLNKPLLNKDKWTDDDIATNNERLANHLCKIWHLA